MDTLVEAEWPQYRTHVRYGHQSALNDLQTCIPDPTSAHDKHRVWVVYIHGGAWNDPQQTATTFDRAQDMLLRSPACRSIAGFASLNYRLSPTPSSPSDQSNLDDPARNAKHPDHINDVLSAILYLQQLYRFEDRYILVGHSCGACLALQVAMRRSWKDTNEESLELEQNVVPPRAVVGIEGLYDLPALVAYHDAQPYYRAFVERAFGTDETVWKTASPTQSDFNSSWPHGKLVLVTHSREDELVEWEQPDLMMRSLSSQGFTTSGARRAKLLEVAGKHDEVWQDGRQVVNAIEVALDELKALK